MRYLDNTWPLQGQIIAWAWRPSIRFLHVLALAAILPATLVSPLTAVEPQGLEPTLAPVLEAPSVRVLRSDPQGVLLELTAPRPQLAAGQGTLTAYQTVHVAGFEASGVSGAPQVPVLGIPVGVPAGAEVTLRVVEAIQETLPGVHRLGPAPTQGLEAPPPDRWESLVGTGGLPRTVRFVEDPAIYGADTLYPGAPVRLAEVGQVRSQGVALVEYTPLQANALRGELRYTSRAVVELAFRHPRGMANLSGAERVPEPDGYEQLLRESLVNYETARAWRAPRTSQGVAEAATPAATPDPGYKVLVRETGMYELTYAELADAGLPVDALDAETLQMFHHGQELAIYVAGEGDGSFDPGDYLLFYGEAIGGKYKKYTEDNVYWLTYGQATGMRMPALDGAPVGVPGAASFQEVVHFERDAGYWSNMPGADDDLSRWYWDYASAPGSITHSVVLTGVVPVTVADPLTATIRVSMYGYTDMPPDPDQHIVFWVNDNRVGEFEWDGITAYLAEIEFDQGFLSAGTEDNTVRFEALLNPGVDYSYPTLDWFEIGYQRVYRADGDALAYSGEGTGDLVVDGFSSLPPAGTEDLTTFNVTDPLAPTRALSGAWEASDSGYRVRFARSAPGVGRYWTGLPETRLHPASIEQDSPSDLRSTANGADYIMITHGDFYTDVLPLRDFYDAPGFRTVLVDVQDVYDEFSGGVFYPGAIRDFLAYAYDNWVPPAPSYVLLVGDGHYDFKYASASTDQKQYIPPYLSFVDPVIGEAPADNRYVSVAGGDIWPDMHLGRFPVNSPAEAQVMVAKSIAYQAAPAAGDWADNLLFVADNPDAGGNFYALSDDIITQYVPATYTTARVYHGTGSYTTAAATKAAIMTALNEGQLLVSYIGHAAIPWWAEEKFFRTGDVAGLSNGNMLPVMLPMTCQEGFYANPASGFLALSEVLVRAAGKGAVASWAPTGWGVAQGHHYLQRGFYDALFHQGVRRLGDATTAGKLNLWTGSGGAYRDLIDTYGLLGDPALRIQAQDADLQVSKAVEPAGTVHPGDVLTYTLTFTNAGSGVAHSVVLSDVLPATLVDAEVLYESPVVASRVPGARYAWEIADLAPSAGGEIRLRATVDLSAGAGVVVNRAEMESNGPEAEPSDNVASVSTTIVLSEWRVYLPMIYR